MSKLIFVLLVAVAAVSSQVIPNASGIDKAARSGNWDLFKQLLTQQTENENQDSFEQRWLRFLNSFQGSPETHVYAHSVSEYKSSNDVNGRRSEFSAGHQVINNDGRIEEFDFKP